MKAQKHETFKAYFEAICASNQKIFGIYTSLIVYFPLSLTKVQKLKIVFAGLFPSVSPKIVLYGSGIVDVNKKRFEKPLPWRWRFYWLGHFSELCFRFCNNLGIVSANLMEKLLYHNYCCSSMLNLRGLVDIFKNIYPGADHLRSLMLAIPHRLRSFRSIMVIDIFLPRFSKANCDAKRLKVS